MVRCHPNADYAGYVVVVRSTLKTNLCFNLMVLSPLFGAKDLSAELDPPCILFRYDMKKKRKGNTCIATLPGSQYGIPEGPKG